MKINRNPDFIRWAYRIFLDREVENNSAVDNQLSIDDTKALRDTFLSSKEFLRKNPDIHKYYSPYSKRMLIEAKTTDRDLEILFEHIQSTWFHLGVTEPHWSVLSSEKFKQEFLKRNLERFYDSGQKDVEMIKATLLRNNIELSFESCLEYGCGLGRVTFWLSKMFEKTIGLDISKSHLQLAERYFDSLNIKNIELVHLEKFSTLNTLDKVNFIFSRIVLQHNPPPIIEYIISKLIDMLNPNGIFCFQVPTFSPNYSFNLQEYLENKHLGKIEMHCIPQAKVFEIAQVKNAKIIECIPDDSCKNFAYSNFFVIQKSY